MDQLKPAGDVTSIGFIVGAMGGWLPAIAALLAIIWWMIRIYETKTVQGWIKKPKTKAVCAECSKKVVGE